MASYDSADDGSHDLAVQYDPFVSPKPAMATTHHRFSNFDPNFFALAPNASPSQARKALQAHLSDTDRRMEEAGKLGTALVQQRKQLEERLRDLESIPAEEDITPDLREKLAEIEKEYNEVARESARAFIPKQRVPSNEAAAAGGSPFVPEARSGRRSVSPSKFEAQATGSPTKLNVPNRKARNQPANRVHDIEFATEISTSLIAQVRNLQALLSEKEEELREVKVENSKLEYEVEGFQQRVKSLDESENRYKDENWNLETQIHEFTAAQRDALDREKKLVQSLNVLQAEKNATQRELDEVRVNHSKLSEEHAAIVKQHDIELGTAKRTLVMADTDKATLRRKIDDLAGQNSELAKAFSSQRGRGIEREPLPGMSDEDFETANDSMTPDHSPPPSPVKGTTPRHSMLESETLKTSLGHAQRTIQSLRTNYHREKTEKMELRRMLQDARDELEKSRQEPAPTAKRARKTESREFRKPPRLLGGSRSVRSEIFLGEDPNWEDQTVEQYSPTLTPSMSLNRTPRLPPPAEHDSDQFETANDATDAAFETANERGTDTDFHTGMEEFSSEDDAQTETESPSKRPTTTRTRPVAGKMRSDTLLSSASTEDDEYPFESEVRSPNAFPILQARFPLRVSRGANRRSRYASEEPNLQSSPMSYTASSTAGTPQRNALQSLAAELGDFDGSDNESMRSATPSRRSVRARTASPPPFLPSLPRLPMVDSGTMTESLVSNFWANRPISMATVGSGISATSYSDAGTQDLHDNLDKFPSPPTSARTGMEGLGLGISNIHSVSVESLPEPDTHAAELTALREEHASQVKALELEHVAGIAMALATLRAEHATELDSRTNSHREDKAEASRALQSSHAAQLAETEAAIRQGHAQQMEALAAEHSRATDVAATAAAATLAREIDSLRSTFADELASKMAARETAHSASLDALKTSHTDLLAQSKTEDHDRYAQEAERLKANHSQELERRESELKSSFDAELEALRAQNENERSFAKKEHETAQLAALAALAATHTKQVEDLKRELAESATADLNNLKASHETELKSINEKSAAALAHQHESIKQAHATEIEHLQTMLASTHSSELEALAQSHISDLDELKSSMTAAHAREVADLSDVHNQAIEEVKQSLANAHAQACQTLIDSHAREIEAIRASQEEASAQMKSTHAKDLADTEALRHQEHEESTKKNSVLHAAALAALTAAHVKQLSSVKSEGEATLAKELASLKDSHSQAIESLRTQHAAAQAQELEGFKSALAKQVESSKAEGDAAHSERLEALNAANVQIVEAHKRESDHAHTQALEQLKTSHARFVEEMRQAHASQLSDETSRLTTMHAKELEAASSESAKSTIDVVNSLKQEHAASLSDEVKRISSEHAKELAEQRSAAESLHKQATDDLVATHNQALEDLLATETQSRAKEIENLTAEHAMSLGKLRAEHETSEREITKDLMNSHQRALEQMRADSDKSKSTELAALALAHAKVLEDLKTESGSSHAEQLASLRSEHESHLARALEASELKLREQHDQALAASKSEHEAARTHDLATARAQLQEVHQQELHTLKEQTALVQSQALQALRDEHNAAVAHSIKELEERHDSALATLMSDHKSLLDEELERARQEHAAAMEHASQQQAAKHANVTDALAASHAQQLQDVAAMHESSFAQQLDSLKAEHKEALVSHQQQMAAEVQRLHAAHAEEITALKLSQATKPATLDFSALSVVETQPVDAADNRSPKREAFIIPRDPLVNGHSKRPSQDSPATPKSLTSETGSTSTVRVKRSQESLGNSPRWQRIVDPSIPQPSDASDVRRPGSAASKRSSLQDLPPLPTNHREAIEAARTQSPSVAKGNMGPPLMPASAYRPSSSRPRTPSSQRPMSPGSINSATVRAGKVPGHADVQGPNRLLSRSRHSSVSSFASEVDNRFNVRGDMAMAPAGFGPNTDPRMIQAITQTMIGEYLWKYTRKAGRGEMSENRHRRYFWVHPYTRTLYWGDRDPSTAGRAELRAKSVPIEAVRVVTDDNPMPPGLHRKSLIVISPGRTVKFTCTTGQRHETWFNALSYLLLRTDPENQVNTEDVASQITQDDIDEFNPSVHRRNANGTRPHAPASLSSYNSQTFRGTDSPQPEINMSIPTLTPTHERGTARPGTLSRLSGYFKSSTHSIGTISSRRSRGHAMPDNAIYEASEVHDSAEDLRQIIEEQDRESDRLENVRACCDGKHDVGSLSHAQGRRGRLSTQHAHPSMHNKNTRVASASAPPPGSIQSRA
ncbi:pleckstrin domain-containing protein [Microdochium nivale]|nr:pleckstrin domain-containing protein [Microdochium nivale]